MTNDGGLEWVTDYKTKIMGNRIAWTSKLTAYQPVFYSGKSDLEDLSAAYLDSVGVDRDVARLSTRVSADWENIWTSQITKILSVSLYTRWIYDPYDNSVKPLPAPGGGLENPGAVRAAVRKAGQFKETLSLGLTVRFVSGNPERARAPQTALPQNLHLRASARIVSRHSPHVLVGRGGGAGTGLSRALVTPKMTAAMMRKSTTFPRNDPSMIALAADPSALCVSGILI